MLGTRPRVEFLNTSMSSAHVILSFNRIMPTIHVSRFSAVLCSMFSSSKTYSPIVLQGVHRQSCFPRVDLRHMTAQQLHLCIFLATLQQGKWVNGEALATDGPSFVLCQDLSKRTIQHLIMAPFYHEFRFRSSLWTALVHGKAQCTTKNGIAGVCAHYEKCEKPERKY